VAACFGIWYQLRLGDLLYRDKAECAFDEFLSTPRKDKPFLACPCVCNLRRRNERGILLTPKGNGTSSRSGFGMVVVTANGYFGIASKKSSVRDSLVFWVYHGASSSS
jgi:hypothetical protein